LRGRGGWVEESVVPSRSIAEDPDCATVGSEGRLLTLVHATQLS